MLFSGIPFLYYFLPIVLLLYFLAPQRLKNTVLLLSSLFFYAWGEPMYVFLMIGTVLLQYFLGLGIEKYRGKKGGRFFLLLAIISSLGVLGYFKYADFFIGNFSAITGISVPLLHIALPIGISFYTFQILSYNIDVYRGDVAAQRNIITLGTYIALFPQLIAGPIVRYSDVEKQLKSRTHSMEKAAEGARRFVLGLSKKILLANTLGELVNAFHTATDTSVLFYWLFAAVYMLQVYFDFSGYSDMAIGLGKVLGFDFIENFRHPFISASISEFWRRWHISLGSWFRDYVYIPMGGNRVKPVRLVLNILTVWFLTGFWHGAAWNFIVWGLYFAVFLMAEKFLFGKYIAKTKVLKHLYVLFFVAISFVIFSADGMGEVGSLVGGLFGAGDIPLSSGSFVYAFRNYGVVLAIAAVAATPLGKCAAELLLQNRKTRTAIMALELPLLIFLFLACTAYLVDGAFNPFLYFRF